MPRCYMVKKGSQRHDAPPPCSPTEASVAPPCYSPRESSAVTDCRNAEYAELEGCSVEGEGLSTRSAADTEAAHELLSLAAGVPPLPPTTVLTVLQPLYTYTLQPTSILILHEPHEQVYHAMQPAPPPTTVVDQQLNYVQYKTPSPLSENERPSPASPAQPDSDSESIKLSAKDKSAKYDCNECGKRYATSSNLSRHKQTHRSLDSLSAKRCGECGKAYVSMPALAMHVLTHRMGHVCKVCGKQFSRPWLLHGHQRLHTGEKPYRCAECGKAFADRSNLRAHLQTHSADKKYECGRCRKTFALKTYLNKHQESACVRQEEE